MRKSVVTALAALASAAVFGAVTGSITTEGGATQKGVIRWSMRDKAYAVMKGNTEIQVKPADVAEIAIDKPAGYDEAVAQVQKGKGEAAIPALQQIVREYRHLQWDKIAGRYLAEAYLSAGKANDALRACETIIDDDATAAYTGELAPAYWSALLALGRKAKLEAQLEKAAKSGDRFSVGAALTLRGDVILKEGAESNDAPNKAPTDGYLRVVFLYADDEVADRLRPEALYKAAHCFDKLGQSGRADAMRTELKQNYAASPWAAR